MGTKLVMLGVLCLLGLCASFASAHWWGRGGWGNGGWGNGNWGGNGWGNWGGRGYNNGWGNNYYPYNGGGWGNNYYGGGWGGGGGGGYRRHWWDVSAGSKITDPKTACILFIEQYADDPVPADKIDGYVRNKFFNSTAPKSRKQPTAAETTGAVKVGKIQKADKTEQLAPFVFHCCHVEYGKFLLKNPTSLAATQYAVPPLPKGATCKTLTDELYKQLTGKA